MTRPDRHSDDKASSDKLGWDKTLLRKKWDASDFRGPSEGINELMKIIKLNNLLKKREVENKTLKFILCPFYSISVSK